MPASKRTTRKKVKPAVWFVAENFYKELKARSSRENGKVIFRGSVVEVYRSLNVSQGYYSEVRRGLEAQGSLLYLSRGARNTPSVIEIGKAPKFPEWQLKREQNDQARLTEPTGADKLRQELDNIHRQIGGINYEEAIGHIQKELDEVKQRISVLERATNAEEPK